MAPWGSERVTSSSSAAVAAAAVATSECLRTDQFRVVCCHLNDTKQWSLCSDDRIILVRCGNVLQTPDDAKSWTSQGQIVSTDQLSALTQQADAAAAATAAGNHSPSEWLVIELFSNQTTIDNAWIKCHAHPAIQSVVSSPKYRVYAIKLMANGAKSHREVSLMLPTNGLLISLSLCRVFLENFEPKTAGHSGAAFEASFRSHHLAQAQVVAVTTGVLKLRVASNQQQDYGQQQQAQAQHEFFLIEVY